MPTDKETKLEFRKKTQKDPDKYYATTVLKEEGFHRDQCTNCQKFFWSTKNDQSVCGDPACSGGFRFFGKSPAKKKMDYIECWNEFATLFKKLGYTPIDRYPVVARWRTDTDFVQASIYDFQPHVVSGEVSPPANPLVVPQFCLRFNDIDNVGITGAHYTGFVMIGQHAFMPPEKWDQAKYFGDIHTWLKKGLGLPNDEITFHEDAWAGGGNFGPCMEYFSRGLELGNQVYMQYEMTPSGPKELKLKVLDMGMGHERNAWFTKGAATSYETTFPTVCKKLFAKTQVELDPALVQKFLPYSSYLNVDEVEDLDKTWGMVARKVGVEKDLLKQKILPMAASFSVAEHSRSLLVALADGALPSNVGGGYNLRIILRRALSFIDHYGWDLDLGEIAAWHADYLKPLFPELRERVENVKTILAVEKRKYEATKQKSAVLVAKFASADIGVEKLVELYDSHGISPEVVQKEAALLGKVVKIPDDFYAKVAARHDQIAQVHATKKGEAIHFKSTKPTVALYFKDYTVSHFKATVVEVNGQYILLDQTYFYPTSGGQMHDTGTINGENVVDVFKQGPLIVHKMNQATTLKAGQSVEGIIDWSRRRQHAQHHTATHIMNAAARTILGPHINQAGAKKTVEKATIDITHWEIPTEGELERIEKEANRIVHANIKTELSFMPREEAEKRFGMAIYQGGVVPGKELRIVNIPGIDVECCGGTHLNNTSEAGEIKIEKVTKIQDGVVRITYTAGDAAKATQKSEHDIEKQLSVLLSCTPEQIPARCQELFVKWKAVGKAKKGGTPLTKKDFILSSTESFNGDVVLKAAEILKTQREHVAKTVQRFFAEIEEYKKTL